MTSRWPVSPEYDGRGHDAPGPGAPGAGAPGAGAPGAGTRGRGRFTVYLPVDVPDLGAARRLASELTSALRDVPQVDGRGALVSEPGRSFRHPVFCNLYVRGGVRCGLLYDHGGECAPDGTRPLP